MLDVHKVGLGAWPSRTIIKTTVKIVHLMGVSPTRGIPWDIER